jgi:hypothetical protein
VCIVANPETLIRAFDIIANFWSTRGDEEYFSFLLVVYSLQILTCWTGLSGDT